MNNRSRAVVWVLAVFLIGALTGGGMVYLFMAPRSTAFDSGTTRSPRGGPRDNPERMMDQLSQLLALSEQQKIQMRQIFDESRKDYHKAFGEVRDKTHRKFEEVLTAEQVKKFDDFMRERQKERERRDRERRRQQDNSPGTQRKQP